MKLKKCKVGQLVKHKGLPYLFEIVTINAATVDIRSGSLATYMFVQPKYLKRLL